MKKAIIAKKIGMTQVFTENGALVPVTVLEAGPCVVVQKKTLENDGYEAIQVGFAEVKEAKVTNICKDKDNKIIGLEYVKNGKKTFVEGDYIISSMPIKDLVEGMNDVFR